MYKFCPSCKEELQKHGEHFKCPNCGMAIYKNSKPCASILPIKNGQVLLGKRAVDPFKGEYDLIGGFLENGELPWDGAQREALEEAGITIKLIELLGIYIDTYGEGGDYTLNISYIVEITGGKIEPNDDVDSLEWVSIENLPLIGGFRNTQQSLKDLQKWYKKTL